MKLRTKLSGAEPRIFSIFSIITGVNLGMTSRALRFSRTCSGLDAPRMTVEVLGFFATQARARADMVVCSSMKRGQYLYIYTREEAEDKSYLVRPI
jgi:hypothetical protein